MNYHGALRFSEEVRRLYPEDFDSDSDSSDQIAAINYYMGMEKKVEELFKWINGRNYTMAIWDGTGEFERFYQTKQDEELYIEEIEMAKGDPHGSGAGQVYYVFGSSTANAVDATWTESGLRINLGDGNEKTYPLKDNNLTVVVIDQYNQKFVYSKSFRYADGQYVAV